LVKSEVLDAFQSSFFEKRRPRSVFGPVFYRFDRLARYLAGTLGFGPVPLKNAPRTLLARYLAGTLDLALYPWKTRFRGGRRLSKQYLVR